MRRFFISFLGSMAALWVSAIIVVLGFVGLIVAISVSSLTSKTSKIEVQKHSILHLDLSSTFVEHNVGTPQLLSLLEDNYTAPVAISSVVNSIEAASKDKNIEGLFIESGPGDIGEAQANAVIRAINKFKKSGKWVYSYGDIYSQSDYYIAAASDSIFINPIGSVDVHGLSSTTMYYKDLADKLGIKLNVIRVGAFKSAVEPYVRNDMSPEAKLQNESLIKNMWASISATIAKARGVTPTDVNAWADSIVSLKPVDYLKAHRLVDKAVYRHEMRDILNAKSHNNDDEPRLVSINEYSLGSSFKDLEKASKKHIAVLFAEGEIYDSGKAGISASKIISQIEDLMDDEDVQGLILRVNSPGGSAFASEQIWESLEQYKKVTGKPFYVSMSDVAASGGYYISCGADQIFAEPLTITGSIGIFAVIPEASTLLNDKLGIHTDQVSTNPQGELPTLFTPMTDRQRAALQTYVNHGYDLFLQRCAAGRKLSVEAIRKVAEGRVWDGNTAKQIGLVDQLGGLDMAIAEMAKKTHLSPTDVRLYPVVKNQWIYELLSAKDVIEERAVKSKLGVAYPFYQQVQSLKETSVMQARMELSVPK